MIDPLGGPAYLWPLALAAIGGYLIGSIPFGLLLARAFGAGDLRRVGSGNIGATNVLRTGRKGLAAVTLLLDALKGFLPAWLLYRYFGPDMAVLGAAGAVLGHCFPVWLKFRGGKGVATAAGVAFGLTPLAALAALGVFVLTVALSRYVSLGSILAVAAAPPVAYLMGHVQFAELYILVALIVTVRHAGNIRRLVAGSERKLTFGRSAP